MQWYREANRDYLCVDPDSTYRGYLTGRMTALDGMPESMYTGPVSPTYLESNCAPVRIDQVPAQWLPWGRM